jgi:hypothetical protein
VNARTELDALHLEASLERAVLDRFLEDLTLHGQNSLALIL